MSQSAKSRGGELVAAAVVIAGGTSAYAEPVRFENEGNQFDWLFNTLDITMPSDMQGGPINGSSIHMNYFGDYYPTFSYQHTYSDQAGAFVFSSGFNNNYAAPFESGQIINGDPGEGAFEQFFTFEFTFTACDYYDPYDCYDGNRGILPEGVETYLGVSITLDSNVHYGWVGVVRSGAFLDVFAWGYETEAGVGIPAGIPSPAALGALAFGAAGGLIRRPKRA